MKRKHTTTKLVVWACLINGVAWVWCSYLLAYLGRAEIAESLSKVAITEIIGEESVLTGSNVNEIIQGDTDYFSVDARDKLHKIKSRSTIEIKSGFACLPKDDPLNDCVRNVSALEGYFDVAVHGTPTAVCFGTRETNMSPRTLASIIQHNKNYVGQKIRLLSCSAGQASNYEYCFAEELANALGVEVVAPNDVLYISKTGMLTIGELGDGEFAIFRPNQRRRRK